MAQTSMPYSSRAAVLGFILVGAVGFWALPLASAYAVYLVPSFLVGLIGPAWYFVLVSMVAGGAIGTIAGGFCGAALAGTDSPFFAAIGIFSAAAYLVFAVYAGGGLAGPGWWTPLVDAVSFLALFISTSLVVSRGGRAHAI
jgi:hypothetical protein